MNDKVVDIYHFEEFGVNDDELNLNYIEVEE